MRLESVSEKDKRWSGVVSTAAPVATGPATVEVFFVSNRTAKRTAIRTRDNAWKIGDQAMNKCGSVTTSAITRGRF